MTPAIQSPHASLTSSAGRQGTSLPLCERAAPGNRAMPLPGKRTRGGRFLEVPK
jgi:hypothetical protein